ncbi:MAG: hypothetical protein AAGN46_11720 [Acidobacteriota bacterium]
MSPISDAELLERSPIVIVANVRSVRSAPGPSVEVILEILENVRGEIGEGATLRLPGGLDTDGTVRSVGGTPILLPGDRVLLFARATDDGELRLVEHGLGAFELIDTPAGMIARRQIGDIHRLESTTLGADLGGLKHADADAPLRDAERFVTWLERRTQGLTGGELEAADYLIAGLDPASLKYRILTSSSAPPPYGCGDAAGLPMRWFTFDTSGPIGFRSSVLGQPELKEHGVYAFRRALAAWSADPHSNVELVYGGLTSATGGPHRRDEVNSLLLNDPFGDLSGSYSEGGVIAVTAPWVSCEPRAHALQAFHPIVEADIVLQDGVGILFALSETPERLAEQIFGHQLGHALGLSGSRDEGALMSEGPQLHRAGALLAADDLLGLWTLYGTAGPYSPETAPAGLTAEAQSSGVLLTWSDRTETESLFAIQRSEAGGPFEPIGYAAVNTESYLDSLARPGWTYSYRLRAVGAAGASAWSSEATVEVVVGDRPAAPAALRAVALGADEALFQWRDPNCGAAEQRLQILAPGRPWEDVPFALPTGAERLSLAGLAPATTYRLRLVADGGPAGQAVSQHVAVTTLAADSACNTADALCLDGGRFRVAASLPSPFDGSLLQAQPIPSSERSGFFWFFSPENVELAVEITQPDPFDFVQVRVAAVTDLPVTIEVTDLETSETRFYSTSSDAGLCGAADLAAFPPPLPPLEAVASAPAAWIGEEAETQIDRLSLKTAEPLTTIFGAQSADAPVCPPHDGPLRLRDGRFEATLTPLSPDASTVHSLPLGDASVSFGLGAADDVAVVLKVLDGGVINGRFWAFSSVTDRELFDLEILDRQTGMLRSYRLPPAVDVCGWLDAQAFPSP